MPSNIERLESFARAFTITDYDVIKDDDDDDDDK